MLLGEDVVHGKDDTLVMGRDAVHADGDAHGGQSEEKMMLVMFCWCGGREEATKRDKTKETREKEKAATRQFGSAAPLAETQL
jgi:hypothetical protein